MTNWEVVVRIIATIVSVGACAIAVLASAGCGNTGPAELTTEPAAPPAGVQNDEPAPTAAGGAQQWAMPDLVGSVLQDAQDRIQALTGDAVYLTGSHDLRGENRNQVLDANWTVCTQNVPPGAAVTPASRIDFGVVKIDEACP
ncbi:MAG TPA: hypothetical protein VGP26_08220 [Actinophytocola sp.]|nr:hypothetical protein [Actinophytocola sp.]